MWEMFRQDDSRKSDAVEDGYENHNHEKANEKFSNFPAIVSIKKKKASQKV